MPQQKDRKTQITQRAQALALFEYGVPIQHVMTISGLSKNTIYALRKKVRERGYNPTVSSAFEDKFFKDAPRSGRPKKSDARQQLIAGAEGNTEEAQDTSTLEDEAQAEDSEVRPPSNQNITSPTTTALPPPAFAPPVPSAAYTVQNFASNFPPPSQSLPPAAVKALQGFNSGAQPPSDQLSPAPSPAQNSTTAGTQNETAPHSPWRNSCLAQSHLSAGVTDSALTNHGILQAQRLATHLAPRFKFTHIFSSDLKRAFKTASAIERAQKDKYGKGPTTRQLTILQEQDFGIFERKAFGTRDKALEKLAEKAEKEQKPKDFKDVETKASMASRADRFLHEYLVPIIRKANTTREQEVAVVAHGMILSSLWKCFLRRFALHSVSLGQGVHLGNGDITTFEHLGSWSNTGFLELNIQPQIFNGKSAGITEILTAEVGGTRLDEDRPNAILYDYNMTVRAVNCKDHLQGLKRTGGKIGSSKHDESQKSIDTFFKKRRIA